MGYPTKLGWVDIETTGLPEGNDWSNVHILEFALIVTDMDLNPEFGVVEVIKMTREAAEAINANSYVKKMHKANGLIQDSLKAKLTLSNLEDVLINELLEHDVSPGDLMIAGSGVATYDFQLIKDKLPEFAKYFAYFPFDIGIMRRISRTLAGKDIVNPTTASYGDDKLHRAEADVRAHLAEAEKYREYFRQ